MGTLYAIGEKHIERGSHVYCHISYDHDRLYQEYLKQKSD